MEPEPKQPSRCFLRAAKLPPYCRHCGRWQRQCLLCHRPLEVALACSLFRRACRVERFLLVVVQPKISVRAGRVERFLLVVIQPGISMRALTVAVGV